MGFAPWFEVSVIAYYIRLTLMNMSGLLDGATSGEYYLDGKDVSGLTDEEQSAIRNKQIGFIFQGYNLIASLTA